MVVAFDRKSNVEDTILLEEDGRYVVQKRFSLRVVREFDVSKEDEDAYDKAEKVFENWS